MCSITHLLVLTAAIYSASALSVRRDNSPIALEARWKYATNEVGGVLTQYDNPGCTGNPIAEPIGNSSEWGGSFELNPSMKGFTIHLNHPTQEMATATSYGCGVEYKPTPVDVVGKHKEYYAYRSRTGGNEPYREIVDDGTCFMRANAFWNRIAGVKDNKFSYGDMSCINIGPFETIKT